MKAKDCIIRISHQPKVIIWSIYSLSSLFLTVFPAIGPFFNGYMLYQVSKMDLVKNFSDIFWPSVIGVFLHGLIFQLPHWPLENACLFLLVNLISLVIGAYWKNI